MWKFDQRFGNCPTDALASIPERGCDDVINTDM